MFLAGIEPVSCDPIGCGTLGHTQEEEEVVDSDDPDPTARHRSDECVVLSMPLVCGWVDGRTVVGQLHST